MKRIKQTYILPVCFMLWGFILPVPRVGWSQTDPAGTVSSPDYTLYQIKLSQVKRLLVADGPQNGLEYSDDVKMLVSDAAQMAGQDMYAVAAEFLDSALQLMQLPVTDQEPDLILSNKVRVTPGPVQWSFAGFSGTEIWQQRFGLVLADKDSTIRDEQTNPYGGVRVYMDYTKDESMQGQLQLEGKLSRQYQALQSHAELVRSFAPSMRILVENDFDRYNYQQESGFSYTDNSLEVGVYYQMDKVLFKLENDYEFRHYDEQDEYFPNYNQNQLRLGGEVRLARMARLTVYLQNRMRGYGDIPARDYRENSVGVQLWPEFYTRFSLSDLFSYTNRQFDHGFVDSLFTNDYSGFYNMLDARYALYGQTSLRCRFELESRDYRQDVTSIPDYLDYNIEPGIEFGINNSLTIQAGYRFRSKTHHLEDVDGSVDIEDYYSHGPVFTFDLLLGGGLIASVSNSYQLQRYPNYISYDESGLSLYSNRNVNSVFFFLTWNISSKIEINSMGMLDYDADQDIENASTHSNLFNFELLYKF